MTVEQEQKTEEAVVPDGKEDKPLTAAEVTDHFGRILQFIRDLPWVGLGVLSTCFGGMVLYAYFRHIEYTPSDVTAVLGAGAAIAAVTMAYLVLATFSLAAPHVVYAFSDSCRGVDWRRFRGRLKSANLFLIGSQLLGVGLLFAWFGWDAWSRCLRGVAYLFYPATLLVVVGGTLVVWASWRRADLTMARVGSFGFLVVVSSVPVFFLHGWFMPRLGVTEWDLLRWLLAWVGLLLLFGTLPDRLPVWALLLIPPFIMPLLFFSVPVLLKGDGYAFPKQVMELAGIRGAQPVELRVSTSTCELVAAAAADGKDQAGGTCPAAGGWGVVHAQVLSNLGSRWWIEVRQVGALQLDPGKTLRMTIPAESVQIVRRTPASAKPANACKA